MLDAISTGVTTAIGYVGDVLSAIVGTSGDLAGILPVLGLSIGMGVIGFGISKLKSVIWGF